jgi:hypothetical protein
MLCKPNKIPLQSGFGWRLQSVVRFDRAQRNSEQPGLRQWDGELGATRALDSLLSGPVAHGASLQAGFLPSPHDATNVELCIWFGSLCPFPYNSALTRERKLIGPEKCLFQFWSNKVGSGRDEVNRHKYGGPGLPFEWDGTDNWWKCLGHTATYPPSAGCQWCTPVILATWEAEIGRIVARKQPG